jgi:hypothetical protein
MPSAFTLSFCLWDVLHVCIAILKIHSYMKAIAPYKMWFSWVPVLGLCVQPFCCLKRYLLWTSYRLQVLKSWVINYQILVFEGFFKPQEVCNFIKIIEPNKWE